MSDLGRRSLPAVAGALLAAYACGGDDPASSSSSSSSGSVDVPRDGGRTQRDAGRDASQPPRPVEEGWEAWDDWDRGCNFRLATEPSSLPPLEWEPCPPTPQTDGLACRWLKPRAGEVSMLAAIPNVAGTAETWAQIKVDLGSSHENLVARADGTIEFAMRTSTTCGILGAATNHGWTTFRTYRNEDSSTGAVVAVPLGERPQIVERYENLVTTPSIVPTKHGLLRALRGHIELLAWGSWERTTLSDHDAGAASHTPFDYKDVAGAPYILATAGSRPVIRPFAYAAGQPPIDLLGPQLVPEHGFAQTFTDGHDIVWEQRVFDDEVSGYARAEHLYTAPFSVDPQVLLATRRELPIRPDQQAGPRHGRLGCGYLVHGVYQRVPSGTVDPPPYEGLEIIRLADSRTWFLPVQRPGPWAYVDTTAVTCDEFFVRVAYSSDGSFPITNLARIRFDSLPP